MGLLLCSELCQGELPSPPEGQLHPGSTYSVSQMMGNFKTLNNCFPLISKETNLRVHVRRPWDRGASEFRLSLDTKLYSLFLQHLRLCVSPLMAQDVNTSRRTMDPKFPPTKPSTTHLSQNSSVQDVGHLGCGCCLLAQEEGRVRVLGPGRATFPAEPLTLTGKGQGLDRSAMANLLHACCCGLSVSPRALKGSPLMDQACLSLSKHSI